MATQFRIGDNVREKFPYTSIDRQTGTLIKVYELEGKSRYVVRFKNDDEMVSFEYELLLDRGSR